MGRYVPFSMSFAERLLGNRAEAEDVTQDVFEKIWRQAERWEPRAQLKTWLYRVTYNACIDRKRKAARRREDGDGQLETIAEEAHPERLLQQKQGIEAVRRALQTLPERQRAAVILSYYEGLSNQEAAEALSLELNAFQQLLFRARQNLKQELLSSRREVVHG